MPNVIDKTYLRYTGDELRFHFIADVDEQRDYYQRATIETERLFYG